MSGHCPRCGAPLPAAPPSVCAGCGYAVFVNARPTASVAILDGDRYLALVRAQEPNAGKWDLPGGFCNGWEHPADGAVREAREELGVRVRLDRFIGMYIGEYLFQEERLPVLDCFWSASIVDGQLRPDPSEALGHDWLPLHDPPPMAFATQDAALRDLRRRARPALTAAGSAGVAGRTRYHPTEVLPPVPTGTPESFRRRRVWEEP